MRHFRLIFIFLFLLSGNGTTYAFPTTAKQTFSDKENSQISDDIQTLSPSHLAVTVDFLKERFTNSGQIILIGENFGVHCREIAYFNTNRFIKPGLTLTDIIFPFHTFL